MDFIKKIFDYEKFFLRMNEIDFVGQRTSEIIYRVILTITLLIAMAFSYFTQKLSDGVYIMLAGFGISFLLAVPSWPYLNTIQLKWLPHKEENKTIELAQKEKEKTS